MASFLPSSFTRPLPRAAHEGEVHYVLALTVDRMFASREERRRAADRAHDLRRRHGGRAAGLIRDKLRDPRRRRSRRELRLALLALRLG